MLASTHGSPINSIVGHDLNMPTISRIKENLEVQHLKPEATMSIRILLDLERNNIPQIYYHQCIYRFRLLSSILQKHIQKYCIAIKVKLHGACSISEY
jgi:hypothetical protein